MKMPEDRDHPGAIEEIISKPSGMHVYIYCLYHYHEGNYRRKEPLLKSLIQRDFSAFRGTTHSK
jgi:hypothetical protein